MSLPISWYEHMMASPPLLTYTHHSERPCFFAASKQPSSEAREDASSATTSAFHRTFRNVGTDKDAVSINSISTMGSTKALLKATASSKIRTKTTTEKGKTLAEASTKKAN
jgi:hypothetical protein